MRLLFVFNLFLVFSAYGYLHSLLRILLHPYNILLLGPVEAILTGQILKYSNSAKYVTHAIKFAPATQKYYTL